MSFITLDHALTQNELLSELRANIPQMVAYDSFVHESFNLYELLADEKLPMDDLHATQYLRTELLKIAESLAPGEIRDYFLDPKLSAKDLIDVLEYADQKSLLKVATSLIRLSDRNESMRELLDTKFDNILFFANTEEKAYILDYMAAKSRPAQFVQLVDSVLRSSESLDELSALLKVCHEYKVLSDCPATQQFSGQVSVTELTRRIEIPSCIGKDASIEQCNQLLKELENCINGLITQCADQDFASTQAAQDLLHTLFDDLADLRMEYALYGQSPTELAERLNINRNLLELELKFGVNISYGVGSPNIFEVLFPQLPERWTATDVDDIRAVLEAIPESHLLFSPLLREIQRVNGLGEHVLGARFHGTGIIKIASLAINHEGMQKAYDGVSSLSIVLAHEIGHGLQIGAGPAGTSKPHTNGPTEFGEGELRYDFTEYMALSGWTIIENERFTVPETEGVIIIDGEPYPLEQPVKLDGKELVLVYHPDRDMLLAYESDAKFSKRAYSRTSPWEDFAEAFAEYLFLPERLIKLSPEKFLHLEREFRRYHDDCDIQELLRRAPLSPTDSKG